MVRYVRAAIHFLLILGLDGTGNMVWSIDTSFAVQMDMKSHTRYCSTLGTGPPISESSGQRINTRSSTKLEPVGVHDIIGFMT